jgi:Transposase DDE domain
MEGTVRQSYSTISCKYVCGLATTVLLSALGWVATTIDPRMLIQVLLRAAAERRSLEAIGRWMENVPSPQTLWNALRKLLPARTEEFEPVIAPALTRKLPKSLCRKARDMAIDFHNKPYYGTKNTPGVFRGQCKASTKTFFAYASLLVIHKGRTFTVGLLPVVNGADLTILIDKLLAQAALRNLRPRRLLLDRGFYAAKVMQHLQQKNIAYVIPMIRRGKAGRTKKESTATAQFFVKRRRGWTTYTWDARIRNHEGRQGPRTKMTTDVCMAPRRDKRGKSKQPLVFACHGMNKMAPAEVAELYRKRFRIETSYRQMREGLAQTSSKNAVYRLLLVLIAMVLRNVWVWLHWRHLADRNEKGHRVLQLQRMRAKNMLHYLTRCLDKLLGLPKTVARPTSAGTAD